MNPLRDQFSAVSKTQFDAQFAFFDAMTRQALESAGRLAALNLAMSRDALQRSLGASFALMSARDPRDVLAVGGQAQEQMRELFSYGQDLLGIASAVRPHALRPAPVQPQAPQLAIETVELIEHRLAETVAEAAPAAGAQVEAAAGAAPAIEPAIEPSIEPVVVAAPAQAPLAAAAPVPVAEPTSIARAAGKGTLRAATAPHPAAAPVAAAAGGKEAEAPKLVTPHSSSRRRK
ncbi:phasin family protein [Massilia sp. UMI-21]|nr:phasin family protein [Massilia sp. UMI-21]